MQPGTGTDQTAPFGTVWFGSELFAQTYLSQNLKYLWYGIFKKQRLKTQYHLS